MRVRHSQLPPRTHIRRFTSRPRANTKRSRSERSEESEDPPQADRSSTRVRIAQRDGDAGETIRARGWQSARQSEDHRALSVEPAGVDPERARPVWSKARSRRVERRTTDRAPVTHQSPVSLSRAGLCEWSRRESNPSPPPRLVSTYRITGKQLTSQPRPPLLPGLLPHSKRGASGHGLAPPGAEHSAAWAPPHAPVRPGPRRVAGSPTTPIPPRPPAAPPSTAAAGPRPRPSTPSSSTPWRPSWPGPPRPAHGAWRAGSRRTFAPTSAAASWPTASPASGVMTAPPSVSWLSPAKGAASARRAMPAEWWKSPLISMTTSCRRCQSAVAVGTPVTRGPPHRTRRAELPHRAPTSGPGIEAVVRPGMLNTGLG
jgi:hypothetical protein